MLNTHSAERHLRQCHYSHIHGNVAYSMLNTHSAERHLRLAGYIDNAEYVHVDAEHAFSRKAFAFPGYAGFTYSRERADAV